MFSLVRSLYRRLFSPVVPTVDCAVPDSRESWDSVQTSIETDHPAHKILTIRQHTNGIEVLWPTEDSSGQAIIRTGYVTASTLKQALHNPYVLSFAALATEVQYPATGRSGTVQGLLDMLVNDRMIIRQGNTINVPDHVTVV